MWSWGPCVLMKILDGKLLVRAGLYVSKLGPDRRNITLAYKGLANGRKRGAWGDKNRSRLDFFNLRPPKCAGTTGQEPALCLRTTPRAA